MTIEQARKLTRRLLAGWPNPSAHDPEAYFLAMIAVMSEFPEWAGEDAIVKVDEDSNDFPPSAAKLRKRLEDAVRPYRFAQEWNARAVKQIEERKEMETTDATQSQQPQCENYDEALATYGRPIGPFESGRRVAYRPSR